jgi:hypothetical protein
MLSLPYEKTAAERGQADSYYMRGNHPNKIIDGVRITNLSEEETAAYKAAYAENELEGDFKDYGY